MFPSKQGLEWTPVVLQLRGKTVRRKTKKQKYFTINNLDVHSETQSENQQLLRRQLDKFSKMGRNQRKKEENTQNWNISPPTRDHNPSPAREQSWMENESDELTDTGFRRWVMTNFCELKDHAKNPMQRN